MRTAEQEVRAALARLSQAEAARYPSFTLGGSLGVSAVALSALTGGAAVVGALLGSVSVPLLDGGAARARVRSQDAALEQARLAYRLVVLTALQDVEDSLVSLRGNRQRLIHLVAEALDANPTVLGAQAALRRARALRDVEAAGLSPTLGVSASARRSKVGDAPAGNTFQAGFDATWEPDVFGGRRSALKASEADAQASAARLAATQVSVAAEVAVDYVQLRGYQARLAIARSNLASQQETVQITDWRLQAGLVLSLIHI